MNTMPLIRRPLEYSDWWYACYPAATSARAFGVFAPFIELWKSKLADGSLPAWRDYDVMELRPFWGWMSMAELLDDPDDVYRYTLWGTELVNLTGREMTGLTIRGFYEESTTPDEPKKRYLEVMAARTVIGMWTSCFDPFGCGDVRLACIEVPISRDNTTTVTHVLGYFVDMASTSVGKPPATPLLEHNAFPR